MYYNFYNPFTENEKITMIPFVKMTIKESDKTYIWNKSVDRLDVVSNKFYGHAFGGKLIMMMNATLGSNEDDIPDNAVLVIPYPYKESLQRWIDLVNSFKNYY